jgi:hypothetical protein
MLESGKNLALGGCHVYRDQMSVEVLIPHECAGLVRKKKSYASPHIVEIREANVK